MPRLLWVAGVVTAVIAWVGPTACLLLLLKSAFHLLAWLDGVEEGNVASGFMDGNWSPVQKEIDWAVCKVSPLLHTFGLIVIAEDENSCMLHWELNNEMLKPVVCRLRGKSPLNWKVASTWELGPTLAAGHLRVGFTLLAPMRCCTEWAWRQPPTGPWRQFTPILGSSHLDREPVDPHLVLETSFLEVLLSLGCWS